MSNEEKTDADKLRDVMADMVESIDAKSVGPVEAARLDREASERTDARLKVQLESQAKTQALHLRSVEASERVAVAWERIATALESLCKKGDDK
jgi:hypothetical protein